MRYCNRWIVAILLLIVCLQLSACAQPSASSASKEVKEGTDAPARAEHIGATDLNRVILTAQAAKRLDIQTTPVRDAQVRGTQRKMVPYAAVIYDLHGETWVYTNPASLTFVRDRISVDYIEGDLAVLSKGPASGTRVVTVGAPELYGTELGIGE